MTLQGYIDSAIAPHADRWDCDERIPRHAKSYRNFAEENRRLQNERIAAFSEYVADVKEGRFPERSHLTEMDAALLDEVARSIP
jgi:3-methyl-2-oxobutanoate hydroxymethyltransferase